MRGRAYISQDEFFNRIEHLPVILLSKYRGRRGKVYLQDEDGIIHYYQADSLLQKGFNNSMRTPYDKDKAFAIKSRKIHGDKYCYKKAKYKTDRSKVKITCPSHGCFNQIPSAHLSGQGCPKCALKSTNKYYNGFSKSDWIRNCNINGRTPRLYIIRCYNDQEDFIKVGITTQSLKRRFSGVNMPYKMELLAEKVGGAESIYQQEKNIHKVLSRYKYKPLIHFNGKRECFKLKL